MTAPPKAGPIELTELQSDALTELVNIGVSRAAANLRKMVGAEVLLSVPSVDVVSHAAAASLIGEREEDGLVAVRQNFSGAFSGEALLIIPDAATPALLRAIIGEEVPAPEADLMADEALAETGNIILNGCLATMANMLKQSLVMSLPEVLRGNGADLFGTGPDDGVVLFLYINFIVRDRDIRGYVAMLMDLPSLAVLNRLIDDFIARVLGEDAAMETYPLQGQAAATD